MPQWSGKIPEKTPFQNSLLRLLKNKRVITFQENSRKFVVQILTNNLALNCSGAFFFIGIGYSLKWWYKDQFFVALLKQNLPALCEPQQRVSWETSIHVLKEQNQKFVEQQESVIMDDSLMNNQVSIPFASLSQKASVNETVASLKGMGNTLGTSSIMAKSSTGGMAFKDDLVQPIKRIDLYTNHVGLTFKSPREKHLYQRFVGVFARLPELGISTSFNDFRKQPKGSSLLRESFAQSCFSRYTLGKQLFPEIYFKLSARGFNIFSKESAAIGKLSYPLQLTGFVQQSNAPYLPASALVNETAKRWSTFTGKVAGVKQSRWNICCTHIDCLEKKFQKENKKYPSTVIKMAGWQPSLDALFFNSYLDEIPYKLESTFPSSSKHSFASEDGKSKHGVKKGEKTFLKESQLLGMKQLLKDELQFIINTLPLTVVDKVFSNLSQAFPNSANTVGNRVSDESAKKVSNLLPLEAEQMLPSITHTTNKKQGQGTKTANVLTNLQNPIFPDSLTHDPLFLLNTLHFTFNNLSSLNNPPALLPSNNKASFWMWRLAIYQKLSALPSLATSADNSYTLGDKLPSSICWQATCPIITSMDTPPFLRTVHNQKVWELDKPKVDGYHTEGLSKDTHAKVAEVATAGNSMSSSTVGKVQISKKELSYAKKCLDCLMYQERDASFQKKKAVDVSFQSIDYLKDTHGKRSIWEIFQPLSYERFAFISSPKPPTSPSFGIHSTYPLQSSPYPTGKGEGMGKVKSMAGASMVENQSDDKGTYSKRIQPKKNQREFLKSVNQRDDAQKTILEQKRITFANINFINPIDKEISFRNKKSRLMSGYTYPDMQADSLQATFYHWLGKKTKLALLDQHWNQFLFSRANPPKKTENISPPQSTLASSARFNPRVFNNSTSFIKKALNRPTNTTISKLNPIDCRVLDQACLTSIKIPITPTTFLFRFFQQQPSNWEVGEELSKISQQKWFSCYGKDKKLLTALPSSNAISSTSNIASNTIDDEKKTLLAAEIAKQGNKVNNGGNQAMVMSTFGLLVDDVKVEDDKEKAASVPPLSFLLLPYQKFNHHLSYFPGFSKPQEFFATLPQISHGIDIEASNNLLPPSTPPSIAKVESLSEVKSPASKSEVLNQRIERSTIGSLSDQNDNPTNSIPAGLTVAAKGREAAENTLSKLEGQQLAEGDKNRRDRLEAVQLGFNSKLGLTKQGKALFDCNKRKIAYNGVAIQRNTLTKDLQPYNLLTLPPSLPTSTSIYAPDLLLTPYGHQRYPASYHQKWFSPDMYGELRQNSIWGTLFLGSENPLTNHQCHFFGQRQLSPLNTTHFQRDYLRQLGKETIDQANSKGFSEKVSSIERAKILSFSKKVNSFFFKKRKYTYLLEKKDQWHLLFQEQLRAAFEDSRKYPPLSPEESKENDLERIKISAPLVLARFPILKPDSHTISAFSQSFLPSHVAFVDKVARPTLQFSDPKALIPSQGQECWKVGSKSNSIKATQHIELGFYAPSSTLFASTLPPSVVRKWHICNMEKLHHNLFWRPFSYIKSPKPFFLENFVTIPSIAAFPEELLLTPVPREDCSKAYPYPYPYPWGKDTGKGTGKGTGMGNNKGLFKGTNGGNGSMLNQAYRQTNDDKGWHNSLDGKERAGSNKETETIIFHYPLLTERPRLELSNTLSLKKNIFPGFKGGKVAFLFQWLIQEPLTSNSWSVLSQWFFLLSLLFWIEQTFLENVFPALFALEQALLGGTGIKAGDRAQVVRISKGAKPTFQDLAGIDGLLGELSELVLFLRGHKEHFWNKKSSYGVLLTGPPGTGKTFLVRALANEARVPVLILSVSNLVANKLSNNKPSWSIRHAFRRAKQLAPCILFIDEIDALGKSRGKIVTDINEVIADTALGNLSFPDFSQKQHRTEEKEQLTNTTTLISKGVSWQNWPTVPNRLTTEWTHPLQSTIAQESNDIAHYSLCEEKMLDLLKIDRAGQILTNKTNANVNGTNNALSKSSTSFTNQSEELNNGWGAVNNQSNNADPTSSLPTGEAGNKNKRKFGPLTQLLLSMDGVSSLSGILIMGATNRPELLDSALTRPGRFERTIRIEKPSEQKRIEILQLYSRNLGVEQHIPWSYLANRTKGLTVADLAVAMNYSSLKAILQKSAHTIETIEYGLDSITRSFVPSTAAVPPLRTTNSYPPLLHAIRDCYLSIPTIPKDELKADSNGVKMVASEGLPVVKPKVLPLPHGLPHGYGYSEAKVVKQRWSSKGLASMLARAKVDVVASQIEANGGTLPSSIVEGKNYGKTVARSFHRLAQIAYYQAGKIVIQTLLPYHPPVAFAMLNLFGITSSSSVDTYIPNTSASTTQYCSSLEDRLIGLYGGKAALQLFEYQQLLEQERTPFFINCSSFLQGVSPQNAIKSSHFPETPSSRQRNRIFEKNWQNSSPLTASFAGTGNNFFQSNIGNVELQKATQLASRMVNVLDFYSFNFCTPLENPHVYNTSATDLLAKDDKAHSSVFQRKLGCVPPNVISKAKASKKPISLPQLLPWGISSALFHQRFAYPAGLLPTPVPPLDCLNAYPYPYFMGTGKGKGNTIATKGLSKGTNGGIGGKKVLPKGMQSWVCSQALGSKNSLPLSSVSLLWKEKQLNEEYLRFAISQSTACVNSDGGCEDTLSLAFTRSAYSNRRISVEGGCNFGLSANKQFIQKSWAGVFQLLYSLQISSVNRDRFYPGWFRLYLPDAETTEFQRNIANSFFSLGTQTFIRPSTIKSTNRDLSIGVGLLRSMAKERNRNKKHSNAYLKKSLSFSNALQGDFFPTKIENTLPPEGVAFKQSFQNDRPQRGSKAGYAKVASHSEAKGMQYRKWSASSFLFAEKQLLSKGFNIVSCTEKELISRALINNSFTTAFLVINKNRQLVDYFVDCLIRFQILRQHQILFLFSTMLLSCKK